MTAANQIFLVMDAGSPKAALHDQERHRAEVATFDTFVLPCWAALEHYVRVAGTYYIARRTTPIASTRLPERPKKPTISNPSGA
jgi:hypothetical protein